MPSGSGLRNSTAPRRTAFDRRVAALKGLKKVAGGSATAVPPDSRPPHSPNPDRGSRGHGTTPSSWSRPHTTRPPAARTFGFQPVAPRATGPPCPPSTDISRPKGHTSLGPEPPIRSLTDSPRKGPKTSAAGARTSVSARWASNRNPSPRWAANAFGPQTPQDTSYTHRAPRSRNQRSGSADLRVDSPLSLLHSLGPRPPDLCVRSTGHASENLRPDGQQTRWDRTRRSPSTPQTREIDQSPTPVQPAPRDLRCPVIARPSIVAAHQS